MSRARLRWRSVPTTAELALRFGRRIAELRRARGMSRAKLCAAVGLSAQALARIERGERFNCANLAPLAKALGIQVRDLFDFDDAGAEAPAALSVIVDLLTGATPDEIALVERLIRATLRK